MSDRDGVTARAVHDLLERAAQRRARCPDESVVVHMSALEIYTDELLDLLDDSVQPLKLRDHGDRVSVAHLTKVQVDSEAAVRDLLQTAAARRTTGCTKLNERSSRSHAVYTLTVDVSGSSPFSSKLTLVDLAGSERIKASGVQGTQRRESIHINTDLFVLGKVVNALATPGCLHVPYRDSKLTHLLRDALGGNCRTVLIACVAPAHVYAEESLHTLRYAERSQSITNECQAYSTPNTALLASLMTPAQCMALQLENRRLRQRLERMEGETTTNGDAAPWSPIPSLEQKLERARAQAKAARDSCTAMARQATAMQEKYERQLTEQQVVAAEYAKENVLPVSVEEGGELAQELRAMVDVKVTLYQQLLECVREMEASGRNDADGRLHQVTQSIEANDVSLQAFTASLLGTKPPPRHNEEEEAEEQSRYESMHHEVDLVNSENDILQQQNRKLQDEVQRLQQQLASQHKAAELLHATQPERSQVGQILDWADKEIDKERSILDISCDNMSTTSSLATELRPQAAPQNNFAIPENEIVDMGPVVQQEQVCPCQDTIFSHRPDYVEFYLPDVRVLCSCGRRRREETELTDNDPCLLVNILRPWQVEFLSTLGITTAEQLVEAAHRRSKRLAQKMRAWRKQSGLLSVKTRSCTVALHIWSRTCKAVLKAMTREEAGQQRPKFLNVSLLNLEDDTTVSTLGYSVSRLSDIDEVAA